jgi:hypothetical protein
MVIEHEPNDRASQSESVSIPAVIEGDERPGDLTASSSSGGWTEDGFWVETSTQAFTSIQGSGLRQP